MNTVLIGDTFEDKSYYLIDKLIKNDELGIKESLAKVFRKKGYYSKDREKNIFFDLSIEIWPPNAERYVLLYLIECKSSESNRVPVSDVEEFYSKINQVAGVNVKGIMMTDSSFQEGGRTYAKNKGMMLVESSAEDRYSIILHRTERNDKLNDNTDDALSNLLIRTLEIIKNGSDRIIGLEKLSAKQIDEKAKGIIESYCTNSRMIKIPELLKVLERDYNLSFDFENKLPIINGKQILGCYDVYHQKISIDNSIVNTNRFAFILGHELGHFFLHKNLKLNQEIYNNFKDSEYDFSENKYLLENDKHWIEWQANKFSSSFLLPANLFRLHLAIIRRKLEIPKYLEPVYLDNQPVNKKDYFDILEYLSRYFMMSKISILYRLEDLDLIVYGDKVNRYGQGGYSEIRNLIYNILNNEF